MLHIYGIDLTTCRQSWIDKIPKSASHIVPHRIMLFWEVTPLTKCLKKLRSCVMFWNRDSYFDNPVLEQRATLILKLKVFRSIILLSALLLTSCSGVLYYPNQDRFYYNPGSISLAPTDIYFTDIVQRKLHGWWFLPSPLQRKQPLFFHGNAENLTSHFMHLAWITAEGYNLFILITPVMDCPKENRHRKAV